MQKKVNARPIIALLFVVATMVCGRPASACSVYNTSVAVAVLGDGPGGHRALKRLEAANHDADSAELAAKILRSSAGVCQASGELYDSKALLRGKEKSAGLTPRCVGETLAGSAFSSFDHFRKHYWKAVASSRYVKEFHWLDVIRMQKGIAPRAAESQQLGRRFSYELHHITPIHRGGAVYDVSNIMIVTPKFHKEVLNSDFHFGYGE